MNASERSKVLESYGAAHGELVKELKRIPGEAWQYRPAPGEWSIHEVILHLADAEANLYVRARRFIAEPGSKVLAFDHDRWTEKLDYHRQDAEAALELFKYLRVLTYELLKLQPESVWSNTVEHSQYGVMTLDEWLVRADKHEKDHLGQIKNNYEAWKSRAK